MMESDYEVTPEELAYIVERASESLWEIGYLEEDDGT